MLQEGRGQEEVQVLEELELGGAGLNNLSSPLLLAPHLRDLPQLPSFGLGLALQMDSPLYPSLSDAVLAGNYHPSPPPWELTKRLQGSEAQDAVQAASTTSSLEIELREEAAEGDAPAVNDSEGLDSGTAAAEADLFGPNQEEGGLSADVGGGSTIKVSPTTSQLQRHGDEANASQGAQRPLEVVETPVELLIEVRR